MIPPVLTNCSICKTYTVGVPWQRINSSFFHYCQTRVLACGEIEVIIRRFSRIDISFKFHSIFTPEKCDFLANKIICYQESPPKQCTYEWNIKYDPLLKWRGILTQKYNNETIELINEKLNI